MTLKTRILLVTLVTILLVVFTQIIASRLTLTEIEERFEAATINGEKLLWRKILTNQMDQMEANMTSLARDRDTRNALKDMDLRVLADNVRSTYNLLSASEVLTRLIITDLEGKELVTLPEEMPMGGAELARQSLKTGKVQRGVIFDKIGVPNIAVTFPLLIRGQPIGAAMYIRNLNDSLQEMRKANESEIIILNEKGAAVLSTDDSIFKTISYQPPTLGEYGFGQGSAEDTTFAVVTHPLKDFTGKPHGYMVSIKNHDESVKKQAQLNWISFITTAAIIITMVLVLLLYINRAFLKLNAIIQVVKDIATGDLTPKAAKSTSTDETGQLTTAMSFMLDNLGIMVIEINNTTRALSESSERLGEVSRQTNQNIEKQLAETAQVATAINELASTAQEVARNAADAAGAADAANGEAQKGQQISQGLSQAITNQIKETRHVAESLQRLQDQTNQISDIMGVINDIAEQTNLLALNAAIEAARAGEQGRGFAVVADEVRTLATRTQQSTKEIETTVAKLQEETQSTVATMQITLEEATKTQGFVEETTAGLNTIASSVNNINQMITHIATATEEQTAVTEEIDRNVVNITQLAQQVADDVKHSSTSTAEMSRFADQLDSLVSKFKTREE